MGERGKLIVSIGLSSAVLLLGQHLVDAPHSSHKSLLHLAQDFARDHIQDFAFQILFAGIVLLTALSLYMLRCRSGAPMGGLRLRLVSLP